MSPDPQPDPQPHPCHEMSLLVQADVDGELQAAEAARVAAHLETCPDCARFQRQLLALSGALHREIPRHRAPDHLREAVRNRIAGRSPPRRPPLRRWVLGAGPALAAGLLLLALLPAGEGPSHGMPDWVVAAHVRALQPQHLLDVVSAEQHTVKPWFAGRLPFSPPVRDLAPQGFPLLGARVDALPGSPAAALVYKRREHVINLFVWPTLPEEDGAAASGSREGYNFLRWSQGGMTLWAVSDLNARELAEFAGNWR
ncbi:zf-HC2 domain-containing protein [Pararoseomonas sp. SCSIO 73927]|uniref:anti-sigma factor family protein n=1 Tax=Pararoseomonas sp. SCSIO 73927 TaxID=3114537 RepID=UPI0030CE274C